MVTSWRDPTVWSGLVERYLFTAARNRPQLPIYLNKVDLAEDVQECGRYRHPQQMARYRVLFGRRWPRGSISTAHYDSSGKVLVSREL